MKFKRLLSFVLILCLFIGTLQFPVSAATLDNGIMYVIQNGEAIISNYVGNDTEVVIPAEIKGYPVTTIGKEAFYRKEFIEKVTLPETVKIIGDASFACCSRLSDINIPNSVTQINRIAFFSCYSINNITIPNSVKRIEKSAFNSCYSLEEIVIPDSVKSIGFSAFSHCTSLETVVLPNKLKKLEDSLFEGCHMLKSIVIPDSVEEISPRVFSHCENLKNVVLPKNLTYLNGFSETPLKEFTIPDKVTTIGSYAFNSTDIDKIYLPSSVECIEGSAFSRSRLKQIKIENPSCELKEYAFETTRNLRSVTLPDLLCRLEDYTFYNSGVRTITIPASVGYIAETAFSGCDRLSVIFFKGTQEQWEAMSPEIPKSTVVCFLNDESEAEEKLDMLETVRMEFLKKHMLLSFYR